MFTRMETKVWAGLAGFVFGTGAFTPLVLWLLGVFVFHAPGGINGDADETISAVKWPVALAVATVFGAVTGGTAAYQAPPSNHAGNNPTGMPMEDSTAGHDTEEY